jgi:2-keto-3-deoxy-L-rhamnonate aldolase RhmA
MSDATPQPPYTEFRKRLIGRELVVGTFIKTPTGHATEILGELGFDFVVIDEEHAPFDRRSTDATLLAARAANTAGIVRVPSADPAALLSVLDCGATGVLVPHVASPDKARAVVAACRYRGGRRGFSNSPRAGGYGRLEVWDHVDRSDARTAVIAMIEDPEALDAIDAIVDVEGLDAVFIGRGDLTVALGAASPGADEVKTATERITSAALAAGKAVCAMSAGGDDARWLKGLGVSGMIVASDQGFMRQAAARALTAFRELAD